jgi:hypothetical protein
MTKGDAGPTIVRLACEMRPRCGDGGSGAGFIGSRHRVAGADKGDSGNSCTRSLPRSENIAECTEPSGGTARPTDDGACGCDTGDSRARSRPRPANSGGDDGSGAGFMGSRPRDADGGVTDQTDDGAGECHTNARSGLRPANTGGDCRCGVDFTGSRPQVGGGGVVAQSDAGGARADACRRTEIALRAAAAACTSRTRWAFGLVSIASHPSNQRFLVLHLDKRKWFRLCLFSEKNKREKFSYVQIQNHTYTPNAPKI